MRLINVETMKLEEYFGSSIPKYAILSHCWGTEEVTFQDFASPDWRRKRGASKIERSSSICRGHGLKYIWIDTCCIDKSSSTELSEAINSMYKWYAQSDVCYAYLEDVDQFGRDSVRKSRWFTRGWTLQELIAPSRIKFYNQRWIVIGKKRDLSALLSEITSIPEDILVEPSELRFCSVARKMSWAAGRQTTREEDIAYCLLGIFDVNMPLLYGEGERAFTRLQEEILKETDDQSLFAWGMEPRTGSLHAAFMLKILSDLHLGVLAPHPIEFAMSRNIIPFPSTAGRQPYSMTNKGLHIELALSRPIHGHRDHWIALLDCHYENDFSSVIGIPLQPTGNSFEFLRSASRESRKYSIEDMKELEDRTIFISKRPSARARTKTARKCLVRVKCPELNIYTLEQVAGYNTKWNSEEMVLAMTFATEDGAWRGASSTIMFTDGGHRNSSFAIIVIIQQVDPSLTRDKEKIVDILPKPRDVNFDEWSKALTAGNINWDGTREKVVRLNMLPEDEGMDKPLTIKASITDEEILNQSIDVLTVEISWDAPRVVETSTKWEKFKGLSYFTE